MIQDVHTNLTLVDIYINPEPFICVHPLWIRPFEKLQTLLLSYSNSHNLYEHIYFEWVQYEISFLGMTTQLTISWEATHQTQFKVFAFHLVRVLSSSSKCMLKVSYLCVYIYICEWARVFTDPISYARVLFCEIFMRIDKNRQLASILSWRKVTKLKYTNNTCQ